MFHRWECSDTSLRTYCPSIDLGVRQHRRGIRKGFREDVHKSVRKGVRENPFKTIISSL